MTAPKNGRPKLYPDAEESSGVRASIVPYHRRKNPPQPSQAVLDLLASECARLGIPERELIRDYDRVRERHEFYWKCRQLTPCPQYDEIAVTLGVGMTGIKYGVRRHMGAPSTYVRAADVPHNPNKTSNNCIDCGDLPHRADRPSCAKCGLTHKSEPPLRATDFAKIGSSFAQMLKPENLPDIPLLSGKWLGRLKK